MRKNRFKIKQRISYKRYLTSLKRSKYSKKIHSLKAKEVETLNRLFGKHATKEDIIMGLMPSNLRYLLEHPKTSIDSNNATNNPYGVFKIPKEFDLISKPKESYSYIYSVANCLLRQEHKKVVIDYGECKVLALNAQILLDAILKDIMKLYNKCNNYSKTSTYVKEIAGRNLSNPNINKLLLSVGSPAIHNKRTTLFKDIIPYHLCIRDREISMNRELIMQRKEEDTTKLLEYVINCLDRLDIVPSQDTIDDLCTVIGEILINSEEHSTTNYRYSIGYFQDLDNSGCHYGVFNLVIMNFGESIYEKFNNSTTLNSEISLNMNRLVEKYKKNKLFFNKEFEKETLWTLFALQDGVSSVHTDTYTSRGNGSIRFIDSFFNLKGNEDQSHASQMTILSGNTRIIFDGTYNIETIHKGSDKFQIMSFNNKKSLEYPPDKKFVNFTENYFPGTLISAKIIISK